MSPNRRKALWYASGVVVVAVLAFLLFSTIGPARILYQRPAPRGSSAETVPAIYLINAEKDVITLGRRANVSPADVEADSDVSAVLERTPPGASPRDSKWVIAPSEDSTAPVLVNGDEIDQVTLNSGDVITFGGVDVTFDGSRTGLAGAVDRWESGRMTHLFASPMVISDAFGVVLKAFPVSLLMVLVSFAIAIPGGLTLAFMKMSRALWIRGPATIYIDVIRGTPIFLQILLVFFGLPLMPIYQWMIDVFPQMTEAGLFGVTNSLYLRAFVVLSFNSAAYMAEIFRAGIQSISKGQMEAARSVGMTSPQAMAYVIIPQTVRRILPTMMSEFILLFKDTSLFAAVGVPEMIMRSREVASTTLNVSPYVLAAAFYLVITIPLGRLVQVLENRLARSEGGGLPTFEKSVEDNRAKATVLKDATAPTGEEAGRR